MTGVEVALLATTALGTGANVAGNVMAANAQQNAAERNAALKNAQADELLSRQAVNERILRERSEESAAAYQGAAGLGESGGGIGGVMKIKSDLEETIMNSRREAEFKAKMLRAGADIDLQLGSDAVTAAWITGAGNVLNTGANVYNIMKPPSTTVVQLPQVKETA